MAFPSNAATNTSAHTAGNSTTHVVSLPTGIVAGSLLIIVFENNVTARKVTDWAGFTQLLTDTTTGVRVTAAYKKAIGDEGATITVTTSGGTRSSHLSLRLIDHEDPATQAPEVFAAAVGTSINPDPPALTPTGGAKDYLWIAFGGNSSGDTTVSSAPTNYLNLLQFSGSDLAGRAFKADRALNAASEDPGAFTLGASVAWVAGVIAVHPAASGGVSVSLPLATATGDPGAGLGVQNLLKLASVTGFVPQMQARHDLKLATAQGFVPQMQALHDLKLVSATVSVPQMQALHETRLVTAQAVALQLTPQLSGGGGGGGGTKHRGRSMLRLVGKI